MITKYYFDITRFYRIASELSMWRESQTDIRQLRNENEAESFHRFADFQLFKLCHYFSDAKCC